MKMAVRKIEAAEEAQRRHETRRVPGAFAQTGRPGENRRGDKSTGAAMRRIIRKGLNLLLDSLLSVASHTRREWNQENGYQDVPVAIPGNHPFEGGWHHGGNAWFSLPSDTVENLARRSGWMREMATLITEHPGFFRRMLRKTVPCPDRGMNSLYNSSATATLEFLGGSVELIERWGSPGKAFRRISHGIRRAKEILRGFEITTIPWMVVMEELASPRGPQRGHKLGQRLALATLYHTVGIYFVPDRSGRRRGYFSENPFRATEFARFRGFRLSTWLGLTKLQRRYVSGEMRAGHAFEAIVIPPSRVDDEVELLTLSEAVVRGCCLVEGYGEQGRITLVVSGSGKTYHCGWVPSEVPSAGMVVPREYWCAGAVQVHGDKVYVGPELSVPTGPFSVTTRYWQRVAVREAELAWRTQAAELRASGVELPENVTILVTLEDSYAAGNCYPGTEEFVRQNGWTNRRCVPVEWLLKSGNSRAQAAARVAIRNFWLEEGQKIA